MVFTRNSFYAFITVTFLLLTKVTVVGAYSGLATHDQNPLLIPYSIPKTIASNGRSGIQVSSSLFITNTLHDETILNEILIIDVETYRFDLNLQYEVSDWVYHLQIPLIASNGGFMDDFIIKWHDTFGLPQGHRLQHSNDKINIQYQVDGNDIISAQKSYNGLGDISFSIVHPILTNSSWNIGFQVSLPTSDNTLLSNDKIDSSIWLSYISSNKPFFITLGLSKPGNGGVLKNELKSSVIFAQTGVKMPFTENTSIQLQFDFHSSFTKSKTDALGNSLQMQFGLLLKQFDFVDVQLFFSEDVLVGSAPDITFGMQIDWKL